MQNGKVIKKNFKVEFLANNNNQERKTSVHDQESESQSECTKTVIICLNEMGLTDENQRLNLNRRKQGYKKQTWSLTDWRK